MNQELQKAYNAIIEDFKSQNSKGRGEVNIGHLVSEPPYLKSEGDRGLLSWFFTWTQGEDSLTVHQYCYDRCRVNMIQPDGNDVTVTLKNGGASSQEKFSWLDER